MFFVVQLPLEILSSPLRPKAFMVTTMLAAQRFICCQKKRPHVRSDARAKRFINRLTYPLAPEVGGFSYGGVSDVSLITTRQTPKARQFFWRVVPLEEPMERENVMHWLIGLKFFHLLLILTIGYTWWSVPHYLSQTDDGNGFFTLLLLGLPMILLTWVSYGLVCWLVTGQIF